MFVLREFNEKGLEEFKKCIDKGRKGTDINIGSSFINSNKLTLEYDKNIQLTPKKLNTKYDLVNELYPKLEPLMPQIFSNENIWAWLAAFYFDSICPKDSNGNRDIKAPSMYIIEDSSNWRRYYRHLIATPLRIYYMHGNVASIFLNMKVNIWGEINEQFISRQEYINSKTIIKLIKSLYLNYNDSFKKGTFAKSGKPGSLRRLLKSILPQFQMTYDLEIIPHDKILNYLPKEFDQWK